MRAIMTTISGTAMAALRPAMVLMAIMLLAATISSSTSGVAMAGPGVCEPQISAAARRHGVPVPLLRAVGLTESGRAGKMHPHALNVEGKTHYPATRHEALKIVQKSLKAGRKLVDVGCMQINHFYHRQAFKSLAAMFDPAANIDYSARFLAKLKSRHGTWTMAVARYHAGARNDRAQRRYVCAVLAQMVRFEAARATDSTRKVCQKGG